MKTLKFSFARSVCDSLKFAVQGISHLSFSRTSNATFESILRRRRPLGHVSPYLAGSLCVKKTNVSLTHLRCRFRLLYGTTLSTSDFVLTSKGLRIFTQQLSQTLQVSDRQNRGHTLTKNLNCQAEQSTYFVNKQISTQLFF